MNWQTASGLPLKDVYGPEDVDPARAAIVGSAPGQPPYLRGAYAGMYRSKPWRIFQMSGFGNPEDENERIKFLLSHGETGFIMEHDRNTADHLYNVDHVEVMARREDVGMTGAVIQSVRDFAAVVDDLHLQDLYVHPGGGVVQHGPFALAGYWTVAKRRGLDLRRLAGTGQSDYFLTYLGCLTKQQVPTEVGLRFNCDIIEFTHEHMPRWVPVSIAAYNGADTGLNAYQELGALLANMVTYLDEVARRGRVPLVEAARGVGGVSFRTSMDLFEDVAKLRAARVLWWRLLRERYGIDDKRASQLRIHGLTAGSRMAYQQPLNNIVRGTIMALAAALGGVQSLGVSGYDEAMSVPSEHAHQMSVRIQQVLQEETNLAAVVDPLGGSYFVESLTAALEDRAWEFYEEIEAQGGFLRSLDTGWLHARCAANQVADFDAQESGDRKVVGVTDFQDDVTPWPIDAFQGPTDVWEQSMKRLDEVISSRSSRAATDGLRELERVCRGDDNIMPAMLEALDAEVTLGEIGDVYRDVFGDWDSPVVV